MEVTIDRVRELLDYNPGTGVFVWRVTKANAVAGSRAGCCMGRARSIRIDGRLYREHRLAWFLATGRWPVCLLDHINGDPYDNRLSNLREATHAENARNVRKRRSGRKGVVKIGRRYYARIVYAGRQIALGGYATEDEAHGAYAEAAKIYHGAFARMA
jgi:hypothetical protein